MEKGQLLKSFKLNSFGLHCSKMQMNMCRDVTIAKELEVFPRGMKCLYKIFRRLKSLIVGGFIL